MVELGKEMANEGHFDAGSILSASRSCQEKWVCHVVGNGENDITVWYGRLEQEQIVWFLEWPLERPRPEMGTKWNVYKWLWDSLSGVNWL
jgi:hypothetical protein